jgi:hypothetical protein
LLKDENRSILTLKHLADEKMLVMFLNKPKIGNNMCQWAIGIKSSKRCFCFQNISIAKPLKNLREFVGR